MNRSNLRPFFAYLSENQHTSLKRLSQSAGVSMTQLIREGIDARLSSGDLYLSGYNRALQDAISAINSNNISKMTFPSGKTFGELVVEDISNLVRSNDGSANQEQPHQEGQRKSSDPGAAT